MDNTQIGKLIKKELSPVQKVFMGSFYGMKSFARAQDYVDGMRRAKLEIIPYAEVAESLVVLGFLKKNVKGSYLPVLSWEDYQVKKLLDTKTDEELGLEQIGTLKAIEEKEIEYQAEAGKHWSVNRQDMIADSIRYNKECLVRLNRAQYFRANNF